VVESIPRLRVAVIEDHALVRDSIVSTLTREGMDVVAVSSNLQSYADRGLQDVDLVLLDLELEGGPARPEDVERIVATGARVLVVSALARPAVVRAMLAAGVSGVVSKRDGLDDMLAAIAVVSAGDDWTSPELAAVLANDPARPAFSPREERALILYASGLKLESVARQLGVAPSTAKEYLQRVRAKYAEVGRDARTKTELYRAARADGLLDMGD
jgi:DNA-binding NarL/FixJ family response regulator